MRKVRISSQVTALISLFEFIGGVSHVIIFAYCKRTSFVSLINDVTIFFILLPYTFLMNSSVNRNRIVEYGWRNVLKNIFGKPNGFLLNDNSAIHNGANANEANENENKFATSKSMNKVSNKTTSSSTINVPFNQEPTCSRASPNKNPTVKHHVSLNVNNLSQKEHIDLVARKLVQNAIEDIEDEDMYLEHFRKLVFEFEESHKARNVPSDLNVENKIALSKDTKKSTKGKGKRSKLVDTEPDLPGTITRLSVDQISFVNLTKKDKFKGKLKDRIYIRKQMLNQIYSLKDEPDLYNSMMEQLISLEESFIQ